MPKKPHSVEYLGAMLRRAREYLPKAIYDELHRAALPKAGGAASWRQPTVSPLEQLGLDSLTPQALQQAEDDALTAAWKQLSTWYQQAGRKKQDQAAFARFGGYLLQELRRRELDPGDSPLSQAAFQKSTLAHRFEDLPDLVVVAKGAIAASNDGGPGLDLHLPDEAEVLKALLWGATGEAMEKAGVPLGSVEPFEPGDLAPATAKQLYDLALVRCAEDAGAPLGAGFWDIVEKSEPHWLEKAWQDPAPVPLTKAEEHSGAMVAVPAPKSIANALKKAGVAVAEPDNLHITLLYLGKAEDADEETRKKVGAIVNEVAARHGPISLKVAGFGHFNAGEDGTPTYAVISGRGLSRLQAELEEAVGEVVDLPGEHGWVPHMTLGYVETGEDLPDFPTLDSPPSFEAKKIITAWAGEQKGCKLKGPRDVTKALCPIICAQEEEQVIWYRVAVPGEKDTHGHRITKKEVRKACHRFMQGPMGVRFDHGKDISAQACIVESSILPCDIPVGGTFHGKKVEREEDAMVEGEWSAAIYFKDKVMWEKRKDSDEGISWAGYARKVTR